MTQIFSLSIVILSLIMMILAFTLSKKNSQDLEKNSQFECGFSPMTSFRVSFSLQFFLITIIFLIFDVEIALLLPSMISTSETDLMMWGMILFIFIIILVLGIFYEWWDSALEWKYKP